MKALLLVDIQKGLTNRKLFNKQNFIDTVKQAVEKCREAGDIIVYIQHENKQLVNGTIDWEVDDNISAQPEDKVFSKQKGDAFSNKEMVKYLNESSLKDVIICGLVSHGCIKHTCLGGVNAGYNVSLLKDAHTNWAPDASQKIEATEKLLSEAGVNIIDIIDL